MYEVYLDPIDGMYLLIDCTPKNGAIHFVWSAKGIGGAIERIEMVPDAVGKTPVDKAHHIYYNCDFVAREDNLNTLKLMALLEE